MQGNYVTVYARKAFSVNRHILISTLLLTVDFDDGFVLYVNGEEVARVNAGALGEELAFDDPATDSHDAGVPEYHDLTAFLGVLVEGENLVAVEIPLHL